jgi:Rod binding domain-containing protein
MTPQPLVPAAAPATAPAAAPPAPEAGLREAAQRLEAAFLKEMLAAAGLGRAPGGWGGGPGEEHFASFLLEAQAQALARAGGVGLAESLFRSLAARDVG